MSIILKRFFKKLNWDMNWINLAQDMDRWWALVNEVLKHRITDNPVNFLSS